MQFNLSSGIVLVSNRLPLIGVATLILSINAVCVCVISPLILPLDCRKIDGKNKSCGSEGDRLSRPQLSMTASSNSPVRTATFLELVGWWRSEQRVLSSNNMNQCHLSLAGEYPRLDSGLLFRDPD